jgi:hypothetical protein
MIFKIELFNEWIARYYHKVEWGGGSGGLSPFLDWSTRCPTWKMKPRVK